MRIRSIHKTFSTECPTPHISCLIPTGKQSRISLLLPYCLLSWLSKHTVFLPHHSCALPKHSYALLPHNTAFYSNKKGTHTLSNVRALKQTCSYYKVKAQPLNAASLLLSVRIYISEPMDEDAHRCFAARFPTTPPRESATSSHQECPASNRMMAWGHNQVASNLRSYCW